MTSDAHAMPPETPRMEPPSTVDAPPAGVTPQPITLRLASPRGFCAGVARAIRLVEDALAAYGAPVYVRHEIVHNAHVVNRLKAMGAVFVEELSEAPGDRPVIFSAHGAPQSVYDEADARGLTALDATCPLVLKVHNETRRHVRQGRHVILIGHAGHPEVVGTMGQTPAGSISLVETIEAAETAIFPDGPKAYVTQTTLSVDETADMVAALEARFPDIVAPRKADICYATSNRQAAVKAIAPHCDAFLVVGDPTSSNSRRLVETATRSGARGTRLVADPGAFDAADLDGRAVVGLTAGASAPEELVEDLIARIAERRRVRVETVETVEEDVEFRQPVVKPV